MQKSQEIWVVFFFVFLFFVFFLVSFISVDYIPAWFVVLRIYVALVIFQPICDRKQEITSEIVLVRLGIESRASCSASKNLPTTPSLFQSAWQHNSISVNHACPVSGFLGESPDFLKMTKDDGKSQKNNYC